MRRKRRRSRVERGGACRGGGSGTSAPTSSRSRKAEVVEAEPTTVPGPGDYVLPSSFAKAKEKPRVGRKGGGSAAFAKGTQRFAAEPDPDKIMPSAVHYTPNYSLAAAACRRRQGGGELKR